MSKDQIFLIRLTFVLLLIFVSINLLLSILQLINKGDYGYKGILSMLYDYPILLELNQKECNTLISDITSKINFSKIKTIVVIIFNGLIIVRAIIRLKYLEKGCKFGIFFMVLLFLGFFGELTVASISLDYYNKTKYDSDKFKKCNSLDSNFFITKDIFDEAKTVAKWVIKLDKAIISLICFSLLPFIGNSCLILIQLDSEADDCIEKELCWIFTGIFDCICGSIGQCCSNCYSKVCDCCSYCCNNFGICCSKCCGNNYESLKTENNNLRNHIKDLEKENDQLKREKKNLETEFVTERKKKEEEEISKMKVIKFENTENERLLKEEINNLRINNTNSKGEIIKVKEENNKLNNQILKLKNEIVKINNMDISEKEKLLKNEIANLKNQIINLENIIKNKENEIIQLNKTIIKKDEDKKNIEKKLLPKKIEEKQLKIIEFYLRKKLNKEFILNLNSIKIKLLEEINHKFGLFIDSENFLKIALYYIKSKLTDNLTDQNDFKIFSNPVISIDGITFDESNIIPGINFIENKLVSKICEIINNTNDDLTIEDFNKIKDLLKSKQTNNYYINPIVISSGDNAGETIEGNNNQNYKNTVIIKIINDIKELLQDEFFNFEGINISEEVKVKENHKNNENKDGRVNINDIIVVNFHSMDGNISEGIKCLKTKTFAEIEEQLYKKYDEYRETNNNFLYEGKQILRFKTIEQNKIKDGGKIVLANLEGD